jgi:hypothetical protein
MNRFLPQSLIIAATFLLVFLWQESDFASYTVPLLGILTAVYLISTIKRKTSQYRNQILTVFLLTTSALLLIQTTGGFDSYLFFLLYFLCFYIGFTLIPETVFVFAIATAVFFFPSIGQEAFIYVAKLASFLLIAPLAYFFGKTLVAREKELTETEALKEETQYISKSIIKDVSDIVKSEGKSLKNEDIERLKDIVDKSKELEKSI